MIGDHINCALYKYCHFMDDLFDLHKVYYGLPFPIDIRNAIETRGILFGYRVSESIRLLVNLLKLFDTILYCVVILGVPCGVPFLLHKGPDFLPKDIEPVMWRKFQRLSKIPL